MAWYDDDNSYNRDDYSTSIDNDPFEEWLKPNADTWRELHPGQYNQFTGGYSADEDKSSTWW